MSERCPLGPGLYWENRNNIPEMCVERCGDLIDRAISGSAEDGDYDIFPDATDGECNHSIHGLETEDVSLQRGNGAERIVGVTDNCMGCGEEYGAQSYKFTCPADEFSSLVLRVLIRYN